MSNKANYLISIVIPVHNEAAVLENNVRQISRQLEQSDNFDWQILLVENGSVDNTARLCQQLSEQDSRIQWFSCDKANYGYALQQGFLAARGDIIVNFDIDFWDCKFVHLASYVMRARYDILIASKNLLLSKDKRSLLRKTASYVFRMLLFFCFGLRVSDTHGIKAWRNTPQMQQYFALSNPTHHTYDTEVIIRAMYNHHEVLEIPTEIIETRQNDRHILKRVPGALKELIDLHKRIKPL